MKQCPACRTTYTDDSLRFCLADGTSLTAGPDEEPTRVVQNNLRINIPSAKSTSGIPSEANSSGKWINILATIFVLGLLVVAAAGVVGFVFFYNSGNPSSDIRPKTPTATATPTATPDNEKQKLQDELANLQKKIADQKNKQIDAQPFPSSDESTTITATVNSPDDGFLALRSKPNTETGARVTKIPHGAQIEIGVCGGYIITGRNNRGRWCRASYKGLSGWVFDASVKY